jgi:endonuclease G
VIAKEKRGDLEVLAFLMKGEEQNKPLQKFAVPLDRIEELTGIDFFYEMNKEAQASIEHKVVIKNWKF